MSPYVVTTKRPDGDDRNCDCWIPALEGAGQHSPGCACFEARVVSRRAVATLEEAIDWIASPDSPAITYGQLVALDKTISESGGTVGPLPDGTVIEVEAVDISDLAHHADFRWQTRRAAEVATEIIAAYNAAQEAIR